MPRVSRERRSSWNTPAGQLMRLQHLVEATGVGLLGLGERLEPLGDVVEALLARLLRHARVHRLVLVRLAGDRRLEVLLGVADREPGRRIADLLQEVEVPVRVAGLAVGGVLEGPRPRGGLPRRRPSRSTGSDGSPATRRRRRPSGSGGSCSPRASPCSSSASGGSTGFSGTNRRGSACPQAGTSAVHSPQDRVKYPGERRRRMRPRWVCDYWCTAPGAPAAARPRGRARRWGGVPDLARPGGARGRARRRPPRPGPEPGGNERDPGDARATARRPRAGVACRQGGPPPRP